MNHSRRSFLNPLEWFFRVAAEFSPRGWREQGGRGKALVVFQRGGMDGLTSSFRSKTVYYRSTEIAVKEPARVRRAIDLDGFYALHPALAGLKSIYDKKQLAIIHAAGSPDNSRSHFDSQDYMELGTPGIKSTPDGWLNRCLGEKRGADSPFRGLAVGPQTPRMLAGAAPTLSISSIEEFRLRNAAMAPALQKLYASSTDPLFRRGGNSLFDAMEKLRAIETKIPPSTASYPVGRLGVGLKQIARLIKADVGLEIAFAEIEGWDTHVAEGGATGQLANRLKEFGDGLAAFYQDLGDRMEDVVLVTMSEFGRTARENGNRGTDHGHGNVMFVLGGRVRGGKVYGRWPGLAPEVLYEGRDLDLTTD